MRRLIGIRYNNDMRGAAGLFGSLLIAIFAAALQGACSPADDRPAPKDGGGSDADVKKLMPDTAFDAPDDCWKDVDRMMPKTIGECAVIAAKLGWMPYQAGCGGTMPEDPSKCVSASEIALLEKWVAAGMPE